MNARNGFALNTAVAFVLVVGFSLSAMATWLAAHAHTARLQQQFIEEATRQYLLVRHDLESWTAAVSLADHPPRDLQALLKQLKGPWPGTATAEWWVTAPSSDESFRLARAAPERLLPVLFQARLFSLEGLRDALTRAVHGHRAHLTPVTQVNQRDPDYRGEVRLLQPIFVNGTSDPLTGEEVPLAGILAVSLDLKAWLEHLMNLAAPSQIQVELYDLAWHTQGPVVQLGASGRTAESGPLSDWVYDNVIEVNGREWLLRFRPTPGFLDARQSPLAIILFIAGTLITGLIALAVAPNSEDIPDD